MPEKMQSGLENAAPGLSGCVSHLMAPMTHIGEVSAPRSQGVGLYRPGRARMFLLFSHPVWDEREKGIF